MQRSKTLSRNLRCIGARRRSSTESAPQGKRQHYDARELYDMLREAHAAKQSLQSKLDVEQLSMQLDAANATGALRTCAARLFDALPCCSGATRSQAEKRRDADADADEVKALSSGISLYTSICRCRRRARQIWPESSASESSLEASGMM